MAERRVLIVEDDPETRLLLRDVREVRRLLSN
jgi:hypothetical protein